MPIDWTTPAAYLERLERSRPAVNVMTLVPNGQLRLATVGLDDRPADDGEVAAMAHLLEEGMEAGAWGYSTGLEYATEQGAREPEITALAATAARRGGMYATHTRDRDDGAVEAVQEAIRTARAAGARLQVSHLAPRSGTEHTARCIDAVDDAQAAGDDIAFDMHTRLYGLTFLYAMLPQWLLGESSESQAHHLDMPESRERIRAHRSIITGLGDWGRVYLLDNDVWPELARADFEEIGRRRGTSPFDAACDLLRDSAGADKAPMVIMRSYTQEMQESVFAHDLCVPGSDATALAPDGPLAGSAFMGAYSWAAWFWRFMVRETGRLTPEAAIHKLSGRPAAIMGLSDRGVLAPGMRADHRRLRFLAASRTRPRRSSTNQLATGMRHVVVNGTITLWDGVPDRETSAARCCAGGDEPRPTSRIRTPRRSPGTGEPCWRPGPCRRRPARRRPGRPLVSAPGRSGRSGPRPAPRWRCRACRRSGEWRWGRSAAAMPMRRSPRAAGAEPCTMRTWWRDICPGSRIRSTASLSSTSTATSWPRVSRLRSSTVSWCGICCAA